MIKLNFQRKKSRFLLSAILIFLTSGCAGVPELANDPSQGGIIGGLMGEIRGDYDARSDARKNQLRNLEIRLHDMEIENRERDQEKKSLEQQVSQLHTTVIQVTEHLAALRTKTGQLEAEGNDLVKDRDNIQAELNRINLDLVKSEKIYNLMKASRLADEKKLRETEQNLQKSREEYDLLRQRLRIRMGKD